MRRLVLASLCVLLSAAPGAGGEAEQGKDTGVQLYRYTDENGDVHITQDLDGVPDRYRKAAKPLADPNRPSNPGCGPARDAPPGGARIRFRPNEAKKVFVKTCINGMGPVNLIFDTGAEVTTVAPNVLEGFGISLKGAPSVTLSGIAGSGTGRTVKVERVEVEGAKAGPLSVVAFRMGWEGVDGLLGQDFLAHFYVHLDNQRGIIILTPKSGAGKGPAPQSQGSPAPGKP